MNNFAEDENDHICCSHQIIANKLRKISDILFGHNLYLHITYVHNAVPIVLAM